MTALAENDEGPCTDCWDTGINQNERPCSCQPSLPRNPTMIEPTDQDILEALRLAGYRNLSVAYVRVLAKTNQTCSAIFAHARTLAQLRVARDALEKLAKLGNGDRYGNSVGNMIALEALAQIKETTDEQAD